MGTVAERELRMSSCRQPVQFYPIHWLWPMTRCRRAIVVLIGCALVRSADVVLLLERHLAMQHAETKGL